MFNSPRTRHTNGGQEQIPKHSKSGCAQLEQESSEERKRNKLREKRQIVLVWADFSSPQFNVISIMTAEFYC